MNNLLPYIYDYISVLFEEKETKKMTRRIILFGSVARGDFDRESDVDIFMEVSPNLVKKAEELIRNAGKRFLIISERKWKPTGIRNPIKTIVGNLEEPRWKALKSEIISTGITLYGKFETMPNNIEHHSLFTYSLSKLDQKGKMKLLRELFGYKIKKRKKMYMQTVMLETIGGRKLSPNALLVPLEKSMDMQRFFNRFKITPEIREVWVKSL